MGTYVKKEKSECPGKDEDKLLGIMAFPKLASALGRLRKVTAYLWWYATKYNRYIIMLLLHYISI